MESKPKMDSGEATRPRISRSALGRYRQMAVRRAISGAASALGAGVVGLLFWWVKQLG
jgi:hypothetical protein